MHQQVPADLPASIAQNTGLEQSGQAWVIALFLTAARAFW
jgi:hypothetical protein